MFTEEQIAQLEAMGIGGGGISPQTASMLRTRAGAPAPVVSNAPTPSRGWWESLGTGAAPGFVSPQETKRTMAAIQESPLAPLAVPPPQPQAPAQVDPSTLASKGASTSTIPTPVSPRTAPVSSEASTEGTPLDIQRKYARNALGNFNEQLRNVQAQSDLDQKIALQQAAEAQKAHEELASADEAREVEHQHRSRAADAALQDLNAASKDLATYKEDPKRLFHNMSGLQTVVAGAGLLLSTINGSTKGIEILQKGIENDIAAQRAQHAAKQAGVAAQRNAYGALLDRYKDEDAAAAALRSMQLDQAARKVQIMAAGSQNDQVKLRAQQAIAAIGAERDKAQAQFATQIYALSHPKVDTLPAVLKKTYGDAASAKHAYANYLKQNPQGTYEDFVSRAAQAEGGKLGATAGGGARAASIYNNYTNAEAVEQAAKELSKEHANYSALNAVLHPIDAARARSRIDKLQGMVIPAAARMVHGASASEKEIELEQAGLGGSWDPIGTRQERLKVIEAEAKKRKEAYGRGLQLGFRDAVAEESEK